MLYRYNELPTNQRINHNQYCDALRKCVDNPPDSVWAAEEHLLFWFQWEQLRILLAWVERATAAEAGKGA